MKRVLVVGALLIAAACSHVSINRSQLESQLVAKVSAADPGQKVSATCPGDILVKKGAMFVCTVTVAASPLTYVVTITSTSGSSYDSSVAPALPIVDTSVVAAAVRQQEGTGATVTCGNARFIEAAKTAPVSCTVTKGGRTSIVSVASDGTISGAPGTTVPAAGGTLPGD